jgi:hypothetical protein
MEAELAFSIDNPDNDLKTLDLKLTLKDLDEAKQIVGGEASGTEAVGQADEERLAEERATKTVADYRRPASRRRTSARESIKET